MRLREVPRTQPLPRRGSRPLRLRPQLRVRERRGVEARLILRRAVIDLRRVRFLVGRRVSRRLRVGAPREFGVGVG